MLFRIVVVVVVFFFPEEEGKRDLFCWVDRCWEEEEVWLVVGDQPKRMENK